MKVREIEIVLVRKFLDWDIPMTETNPTEWRGDGYE